MKDPKNQKAFGTLLLLITAVIWGMAFAFQRAGMEWIEPATFQAVRLALASLTVWIVSFIMDRRKAHSSDPRMQEELVRPRKETLIGGICCGTFLAAANYFQQLGLVYTTAGKTGFITALYIILVPIIGFLLFRKKTGRQIWLAVLIGVLGLYLLCMTDSLRLTRGDTMVCICAVLFSGHILCCNHFAGRGDAVRMSAVQLLVAALISAVIAVLTEEPTWGKVVSAAVPILYCGIVSAGMGYTFQMVGQKYTDPAVASLLMSLESVFAVLGGAVLLHERMSTRELLGCLVMFVAIILVQIPLPKRKPAAE